jgi:large subunit ribosomal protein L15
MTVNSRSKNSRQRGSHTHGWGAMKKHRGAGNRGGSGKSGSGKRADSTKPSYWGNPDYFGKHGFVNKGATIKINAVNISQIEEKMNSFVEKKLAAAEAGGIKINLTDIGFNKLLGKGKTSRKLFITCDYASSKAIAAVEAAGGKITLLKKKELNNGPKGNTAKSS